LGSSILNGDVSLADLADRVESGEIDPAPVSGQQEHYENVVNHYLWRAG
jgi:xylose isomerase